MRITNTAIAKDMKMTQQSFARWKKNRPEVYTAIRLSYELEQENKELKAKLAKYEKLEALLKEEN